MFKKTILIAFKIIIPLILIPLIAYYNGLLIVLATNFSFQFFIYLVLSISLIIFLIIYPFINKRIFNKILLLLFIFWVFSFRLPDIKFAFIKDTCLDIGYCKQGIDLNTEYGLIKINKENCLKYGWEWLEKTKMCKVKK